MDAPDELTAADTQSSAASHGLLAVCTGLILFGVLMAFSTITELVPRGDVVWWQMSVVRQTAFSLLALLVLLAVQRVDYRFWFRRDESLSVQRSTWLLIVAFGLLGAVLVPGLGVERNGAQRWLSLGPASIGLGFQPSEFAKPALVLFVAAYIAARPERLSRFFGGLLPLLLVIGAGLALIGIEDFGTAALLVMVCGAMLWVAPTRKRHLLLCALPVLIGLAALVAMKPYRVERLTGFTQVESDPRDKGYHAMQSLITIASGGWWGQGPGAGVQKYGYLPEARSDFVFAVVCEELGIVGGLAVIALFMVFIRLGWRVTRAATDDFGRMIAFGATLTIGFQAAINIGVVTVSLPTKGIALPFISAGGSSVLFLSFLAGLLVNVARARTTSNLPSVQSSRPVESGPGLPSPSAHAGHHGHAPAPAC